MRVLHLRPQFRRELGALAARGTPAWTAVSRVLRELLDESVPAPRQDDIAVDLPPMVVGRPVPGTDLVVAFIPAGNEIHVLGLRRMARRRGD